ncbi:MAG TPA: class I SAM-dependent methyltransferase [Verrucomicrobiae bacterium]|nr:class I SAM-dependent methyltransferase [Verrucomicrobiae bacterium]
MKEFKINQRFIDPERVLFKSGLSAGQTIADLGAGSGFYAIAAAKVIGNGGKVYVVDILESALNHVVADARVQMIKNIVTIRADVEEGNSLSKIPDGSCDMVIFANLLHQLKDSKNLLTETYRVLKTQGKILVIEWNDRPSPIGPKSAERLSEDESKNLVGRAGFKFDKSIETDQYHYGLIFVK